MQFNPSIFKDYDVRGTYPDQINGEVAAKMAYAIVRQFSPKTICICRDMRLSGMELRDAFTDVFTRMGVNIYDAGLTGTEMMYYIAGTYGYDLCIMISASHNPKEYNGIKLVKKGPIAVTSESGLFAIRDLMDRDNLPDAPKKGTATEINTWKEWKNKILSLVDVKKLKPLTCVVDAGNGMGGVGVEVAFQGLPIKVIPLNFKPDGNFPVHVPNPLIPENIVDLKKQIVSQKADLGFAFDGDADRIFFIDDTGKFVTGTITAAILAKYFLKKFPSEMILYNAICGRIVPETIKKYGGTGRRVRVGHSYIKTYMHDTQAIFAGEHSGHYYYRDFFRAESGVLTALIILALLSEEKLKISQLVAEMDKYPASGEINFIVNDTKTIQEALKTQFNDALSIDELDGISIWYNDYWINVRASKTEPLLRLNVEADNAKILEEKTQDVIQKIEKLGGVRK